MRANEIINEVRKEKPRSYKNTMLGSKTQRVYNVAYKNKLVAHITHNVTENEWYRTMYEPNNWYRNQETYVHSKQEALKDIFARVGGESINEVIDYGYWDWSSEQFIELAKAARKYAAGKGINLETGDGYEEFFDAQLALGVEEDALDALEVLLAPDSVYDVAARLRSNANYQDTADGITNLIDLIGFEPRQEQELMAGQKRPSRYGFQKRKLKY